MALCLSAKLNNAIMAILWKIWKNQITIVKKIFTKTSIVFQERFDGFDIPMSFVYVQEDL